ncbi:DNA-directed RNA polymerase II subunit [Actinomortierella ambigua]|uniref:DNA-directed RNA polymerase II subunit n=1 Tax=Actinomortierella ambigua TaxID=1343610 RepID=A0A9P6QD29_9FUNG|nr:DNA-directed RNA polymerase II subunit [Actinomortierella ambigua]KAG0265930.1 DNA-directed RNA polymerase II subunit [Actinomortierella ambigua]
MFFLRTLSHTINLHPSYFGPHMREFLMRNLHADVEGTCSGRIGFIISVLNITNISPGKVLPNSGLAEFIVQYQAIVFKPYKGEVVDAIVTSVNQIGFFADVGPLQVFVAQKLMPNDFKFDSNGPCYRGDDQTIEKNGQVRLKIVGLKHQATQINAVGTIKEDYLGQIQ